MANGENAFLVGKQDGEQLIADDLAYKAFEGAQQVFEIERVIRSDVGRLGEDLKRIDTRPRGEAGGIHYERPVPRRSPGRKSMVTRSAPAAANSSAAASEATSPAAWT